MAAEAVRSRHRLPAPWGVGGRSGRELETTDAPDSLLGRVPFFRQLDRVDQARLVGALERIALAAGALVFEEDAPADGLYLLEEGRVEIVVRAPGGERRLAELGPGSHFGEMGLLLARRTATARALTEVRLWKLPRERFEQAVRESPIAALAIATSLADLVDRRSREHADAPAPEPPAPTPRFLLPERPRTRGWRLAGLALAVAIPAGLWALPAPSGLGRDGWHVLLVLVGAAAAWLFEPLPDFVVTLAMASAWGVAGLAPLSLAFAGFSSSSWLLAVGALVLAAAMARSGLIFRVALGLLRAFPPTHAGQVLGLLIGGALVTPLVPLALARVATVASLTEELSQALGYAARSRASAALAFAGLLGYGAFSSIALTGLAMNFFVLDLLPPESRVRLGWAGWLLAALPAGAVMFVGALAAVLLLFRAEEAPRTSAEVVHRQARTLGPMTRREGVTLAATALLVVGLLLEPFLHVDAAWLAIGSVVLTMAGGGLDRERFRSSVDWGFLLLFGILLGTGGVVRHAGIDRWIADLLVPLTRVVPDPGALVVLLAAFVVATRLVMPWIPATLLLSLALVPVAPALGLSPWVVGFVILVAANTWLHPAQSDFVRLTRELTRGELFTTRHGIVAGVAMTAVTLVAIAASVPYWRALGLLTP